jgi:hypothetical protein
MIDLVIENPAISQNELAKYFGYSPAWVSVVFTSDAFKARLAARKAEIVDPVLQASLRERLEALTTRSMEVLMDKLSKPTDQVPDGLALKALEIGSKGLGLGGNAPAQTTIVTADRVAGLAHRLMALQGGQGAVTDVVAREIP